MCSPINLLTCASVIQVVLDAPQQVAQTAAENAVSTLLSGLGAALDAAVKALMMMYAGWLLPPSNPVCAGTDASDWMQTCNTAVSPATQLRAWVLPITVLVATLGLLWQAILLAVTRKGEPLLQALRGLATLAVWSAVGIVGTQLALDASDAYTEWILRQAIFGDSLNPTESLGTALADLSGLEKVGHVLLGWLFGILILLAVAAQIILMVFREGAVIILAGLLQLAAAGSFTRLTSGWLPKVTGWALALVCFKPMAATVYAVAFLLLGDDGVRNSVVGLAVVLLALFALPVALKFFNWTTGTLAQAPSTVGMLGTVGAAGVHAASSLREAGGYHVGDHASYMAEHGPGTPPPPGSGGGVAAGGGSAGTVTAAAAAGASAAAGAATAGVTVAAQAGLAAADAARHAADTATSPPDDPTAGR